MINANDVAAKTGMATCQNDSCRLHSLPSAVFWPREQAITEIKKSIKKTYSKRGEAVVNRTTMP
jgi:pyruvate-ferredoxin/flavodoxin oxidoreductase